MATATWTQSDTGTGRVAQLFKIKYGKWITNYLNRSQPSLGRIKVQNDLDGEKIQWAIDVGYIGGAGASNTVPSANRGVYYRPELTDKTLQVSAEIEHRARELAKRDVGAFVEGQKHVVSKVAQKFQWLRALALWGAGSSGALGVIDTGGVTDNGGGSYSLVITAATYQRRRFQKREIINIEAGNTDKFEITAVTPSTRTITVQRLPGGVQVPAQADSIYLQNSYNAMPISIREVAEFSAGTLYGVTYDELDWAPTVIDASSAVISVDMMNELVLKMHEKCEVVPSALYVNHNQMRVILNSIEDRKNFVTGEKVNNRVGDFGFDAVKFLSVEGPIPIMIEPNLYDTEMFGVVEDKVITHRTMNSPDWIKSEGGDMMHLKSGSNAYEMRWCSYEENEIPPLFVGRIKNLPTP